MDIWPVELDMGQIDRTWPNPTHKKSDPTWPDPRFGLNEWPVTDPTQCQYMAVSKNQLHFFDPKWHFNFAIYQFFITNFCSTTALFFVRAQVSVGSDFLWVGLGQLESRLDASHKHDGSCTPPYSYCHQLARSEYITIAAATGTPPCLWNPSHLAIIWSFITGQWCLGSMGVVRPL